MKKIFDIAVVIFLVGFLVVLHFRVPPPQPAPTAVTGPIDKDGYWTWPTPVPSDEFDGPDEPDRKQYSI